jgi:CheY-like chemotaxis protein
MTEAPAAERTPRLLIADDDPAIVCFLADRCGRMGFEVQTAANGLHALLMAGRQHPDALIIDVNMPEVDGLSVLTRLLEPANRDLPVIVITGTSRQETVDRCESFGAFYVQKGPELWHQLRAALAEIFPDREAAIMAAQPFLRAAAEVRQRPRVLIVDDDPDIETFLASRLRKGGVETLYARDGVQGYRIAVREKPSVIVADYVMPNGDAVYLLSRLRMSSSTASIPVLVMTARDLDEGAEANLTRDYCGHPGATQVFRKSADMGELFAAVQRYCAFEPA